MTSVMCVLLGVAEVKAPLHRFSEDTHNKVAEIAHWTVLHREVEVYDENSEEYKDSRRFIGEVDSFNSMQEVQLKVEDTNCQLIHGSEVILQHRIRDVIVIRALQDMLRIVYVSRCNSYSRAAVIMQMKSEGDMKILMNLLRNPAIRAKQRPRPSESTDAGPSLKESWSKGMGKKFTGLLTTLAGPVIQTKSPRQARKVIAVDQQSPPNSNVVDQITPDIDNSDSDSDEESAAPDDNDCNKSEGKYYEDMGIDASVQARLYEDTNDSVSRTSSSSSESNALVIEAELQFFIDSDKEFVKALKSLAENREYLGRDSNPQYIREKLTLLFSQVRTLILLHTELHSDFEACNGNLQKLSEAIVRRKASYENYVYFMENIPVVDELLKTYKEYFRKHVPNMSENIRKPRMRLHYYVLSLETLHKRSSCADDKKALQSAIDILKKVLKRADTKLFLGAVTGVPFDLNNYGTLIRHNDLALRRGPVYLQRRVYHVLMLKSLILLTISNGRYYRYVTSFRMDQVGGLGGQERGVLFNLEVRNGPKGQGIIYTLKAKNINTQQSWIKDLNSILREKPQPTSPRNSVVENESYSINKGRRSQSIEKTPIRSSSLDAPSDDEKEDLIRSGRTEFNTSMSGSGRRSAIRKASSASTKSHSLSRIHSGYYSEGESGRSKLLSDQWLRLSVWCNFPQLKELYEQQPQEDTNSCKPLELLNALSDSEKIYIENLCKTLGDKLKESAPRPPRCMTAHFRHLYQFHNDVFLPLLEDAVRSRQKTEVGQCFADCSEEFIPLYSHYLVDLSINCDILLDKSLLNSYQLPMRQLQDYIKTLSVLQSEDVEVIPIIQRALSTLRECISGANKILLTEMIDGVPFSLAEQGSALLEGSVKVRKPGQGIRQVKYVVLLESMILMLEPSSNSYRYDDVISMDTVGLGPATDSYSFQLEVRIEASKTLTYSFRTSSPEAQSKWLKEIMKLLSLQAKKLKDKLKRRLPDEEVQYMVLNNKIDPDNYKFNASPKARGDKDPNQGSLRGKPTPETHL